ncbi:MAG: Fe(2+)-trafficking protein [Planctomycetota bacterium]
MSDNVQQERIEQFRKMAADDPGNELGHLSLGRELLKAGQASEAAESFRRTLEINDRFSKAYELLGDALVAMDKPDDAATVLKRGVVVAAERGDRMPREAMEKKLTEMGQEVPDVSEVRKVEVGEGQVLDARTGEPGPRLPRQPMKGPLGEVIFANVSATTWREWIGMGTKVINELRLPMTDPRARQTYDDHMIDFLNIRELYEEAKAKG